MTQSRAEMERRRQKGATLLARGISQTGVAEALGVSRMSVTRWAKKLKRGGVEALSATKSTGRRSRMGARQARLFVELWRACEWASFGEFRDAVEENLGLNYHRDHIGRLVHALVAIEPRPVGPRRSGNR